MNAVHFMYKHIFSDATVGIFISLILSWWTPKYFKEIVSFQLPFRIQISLLNEN